MTVPPNRYGDHWSRADLVLCRDCTNHERVAVIPRDEIRAHDAWHAATNPAWAPEATR